MLCLLSAVGVVRDVYNTAKVHCHVTSLVPVTGFPDVHQYLN